MNSFVGIIIMILFIILFKSAINILDRFLKFKDQKLKFTVDVKKESINKMSSLEFQSFCIWLFEGNEKDNKVEISPFPYNSEETLVLTSQDGDVKLVDCTRNSIDNSVCQKLVGTMVAYNINSSIILTTGDVEKEVIQYLNMLKTSTSLEIKILNMFDILKILQNRSKDSTYSIDLLL